MLRVRRSRRRVTLRSGVRCVIFAAVNSMAAALGKQQTQDTHKMQGGGVKRVRRNPWERGCIRFPGLKRGCGDEAAGLNAEGSKKDIDRGQARRTGRSERATVQASGIRPP